MQNGIATLEDNVPFLYQTKHVFGLQSGKTSACYLPRSSENVCSCEYICMEVYKSYLKLTKN